MQLKITMTDLSPQHSARQLIKALSHNKNLEECLPINSKLIAEALGIKIRIETINDKFEGMLIIDNDLKAIICNKNSPARINFTIAHEIGHYCLHRSSGTKKCTFDDLNIFDSDNKDIEREANIFAANLLMPTGDLRQEISSKNLNFDLIKKLTTRYSTSITATALRVVEIFPKAALLISITNDDTIMWFKKNISCNLWLQRGKKLNIEKENYSCSNININQLGFSEEETEDYCDMIISTIKAFNNQRLIILSAPIK